MRLFVLCVFFIPIWLAAQEPSKGEAHTEDNIIAYIPSEKVLFGSCVVKSLRADKGNTTHANLFMWPETVKKVRKKYKIAEIVIPGHGQPGGLELLDYTIRLFSKR